jgi:two-component system chemotaxis response regulator CheB
VTEAHAGSTLENGRVLVAPGGLHMVFDTRGVVSLSDAPAECGVRPAINVTMESIAALKAWKPLAVVLTGMGVDGTRGAGLIRAAGGEVIAEAESTAIIFGMPRAVAAAGLVDEVRPLDEIADAIARRCRAVAVASA